MLDINNIQGVKTVCDLSCGIGNMFKFISNENIKCFGYEIDSISSKIAQLLYPSSNIRQCDTIEEINNIPQFDYIIGNPPFGGKLLYKVPWESKEKNQPLDVVFTYLAIEKCKEEGYIGLIVPDGILSNSSQKKLREYIFQECRLLAVISLPVETFYFSGIGGTGAKTSIILLQKLKTNEKEYKINNNGCKIPKSQKSVFMAVVGEGGLGWDNKGRQTNKDDLKVILEAYQKGCEDFE